MNVLQAACEGEGENESERERGEGGGGGSREVKICENAWGSAFDL